MINKFMRLAQLHEARYAGKYRLEDVLAQYNKVRKDPSQSISLYSAHNNVEGNYVLARIHAVVTQATEQQVRNQIKQWHEKNNVPFGQIVLITQLDDDWQIYVQYKGPTTGLHESRYYQDKDRSRCPECGGKGRKMFFVRDNDGDYHKDYEPCTICKGAGTVTKERLDWYNRSTRSHDDAIEQLQYGRMGP